MTTRRFARVAGPMAAAALLVLAGCGADDTSTGATASGANHNDADVAFAQDMIPHHQQALVMADAAIEGASTQELQDLAQRIEDAQTPEIEAMTGWLQAWDEEVPDLDAMSHMMMGHGDKDADHHMPGMMDAEHMRQMSSMMGHGIGFDRMWVVMMIEHHEGAIEMAQDEMADGQSPDAIALAEDIVTAQQAEIDQMRQMLDDWQS